MQSLVQRFNLEKQKETTDSVQSFRGGEVENQIPEDRSNFSYTGANQLGGACGFSSSVEQGPFSSFNASGELKSSFTVIHEQTGNKTFISPTDNEGHHADPGLNPVHQPTDAACNLLGNKFIGSQRPHQTAALPLGMVRPFGQPVVHIQNQPL